MPMKVFPGSGRFASWTGRESSGIDLGESRADTGMHLLGTFVAWAPGRVTI